MNHSNNAQKYFNHFAAFFKNRPYPNRSQRIMMTSVETLT